jgi:SAM-dependent methyltransferase
MEACDRWISSLEVRHLADLTIAEVTRALRALSAGYVERRHAVAAGAAFDGRGKRAALALFYAPLHFLLVDHVVRTIPGATSDVGAIVDLGCGTGTAGAAWALACAPPPPVVGIDRNPWALAEAAWTYRELRVAGRTRRADIANDRWVNRPVAYLAAFAINELPRTARDRVRARLIDRVRAGNRVLIVEPIARSVTPWWREWSAEFVRAGGRVDEWRFPVRLPPIVATLDRAAGLDHRELTARTLYSG